MPLSIGDRGTCERSHDGGHGGENNTDLPSSCPYYPVYKNNPITVGTGILKARVRVRWWRQRRRRRTGPRSPYLGDARRGVAARGSGELRRDDEDRVALVAELGPQAGPARQGVYTHKRPLCVDGGPCISSRCSINRVYERPPKPGWWRDSSRRPRRPRGHDAPRQTGDRVTMPHLTIENGAALTAITSRTPCFIRRLRHRRATFP